MCYRGFREADLCVNTLNILFKQATTSTALPKNKVGVLGEPFRRSFNVSRFPSHVSPSHVSLVIYVCNQEWTLRSGPGDPRKGSGGVGRGSRRRPRRRRSLRPCWRIGSFWRGKLHPTHV